ncbi:MucB/RseB C-terminal domain-containing protein [Phytopseudomonas dryadis]|uniref:RNA polymerase subunit sigma n=1 Tax=Phytopseudomonas dryadis TaxID=2487520 RepID=A0A4V2KCN5_9GAMM|nr:MULTISPECIES: MucB/RseB C-terminal domain-containing protein [Pseudomonas]TBU95602.1 RNA polymerase subunit sigma [Pseudomonas dryadis]TBV01357.1 RNA polymerase subunit sigma [Pseudomonas dryadis]TBV14112.1 RNA polymerase subunit sigma [Pseudomonas sp. FRB 230]
MRFIPVTSLVLGSCLAFPAMAADAQAWLQRLGNAERNQSFQGTFVYERNGNFSTHSIWRQVEPSGGVRERLLQLDGAPQEILRVDGQAQCVSGSLSEQVADTQAWPAHELNAQQLAEWYELRVIGESRVAGRSAVVLGLSPRDQHRYGVELHLDRDTGLPLKSLLVNDKGVLLERFQFTQLDTTQAPSAAVLQPTADCNPIRLVKSERAQPEPWRSDWIPPGFTLSAVTQRRSPASADTVDCLIYDDGLARFSVFLEPLHDAAVADARSQLGPTVAVSRRLSTAEGDVMVTVVGEIPLGTAERVALSMRTDEVHATP